MPQINITVAKTLDENQKAALQLAIGQYMPLLPGKNIANTMICIHDGCAMYKDGKCIDGAFVDIRLFKSSPEESKKAFAENLFRVFEGVLAINAENIYMNILELDHWASGGSYT